MLKPGISPEAFMNRINNVESVVTQWPFGHLPGLEEVETEGQNYIAAEIAPDSSFDNWLHLRVVPGSYSVREKQTTARWGQRDGFTFEARSADEAMAWKQMAGVIIGMEFEQPDPSLAYVVPARIRSVEQPLHAPMPSGAHTNSSAGRMRGYVQGVVMDRGQAEITDGGVILKTSRRTSLAWLHLNYPTIVTVDREPLSGVRPNDAIRTRVERSDGAYNSHSFRPGLSGLTYVLNREA